MKRIFLVLGIALSATIACGSILPPDISGTQTAEVLLWTPTRTLTVQITISPTINASATRSLTGNRSATPKSTATPTSTLVPRFRDSASGIDVSYMPPQGWIQTTSQLSSFAAWQGPLQSVGVYCLLNFVGIGSGFGAELTKALFEKAIFAKYPDLKILSKEPFTNDAGLDALQEAFTFTSDGTPIRGSMFEFSQSGRTVYAIYTRYAEENSEQDAIVMSSMKSFQFGPS